MGGRGGLGSTFLNCSGGGGGEGGCNGGRASYLTLRSCNGRGTDLRGVGDGGGDREYHG